MEFKIQKLYRKISQKDKKILVVVFMIALLAHAYRLFTYIPNHDSFFSFYHNQDMILLGRWTLKYAAGISSYFDTQWLCGLLSLIYISITAVIVIKMLDIENIFLCYLVGIIIGVYPSVVCTFTYMFTADAYFLAMLLTTLAAWAMTSPDWKKRLGGSVLLGVSVGTYQAYLSFTMVLLLVWLIKKVLIEKQSKIGRSVFNIIYSGLLGGGIYVLGLLVRLNGRKMYSYQGIGEASLLHSLDWYIVRIGKCYSEVYNLIVKDDTYGNSVISYIVVLFWILIFLVVCVKCAILIKNKKYLNVLLTSLFLAVIPIAVYCMSFLSEATDYHRLMVQSVSLIWVLAIMLLDNIEWDRFSTILKEVLVLILLINIGNYIVGANISYFGFYNGYEKTYALFIRVVDRIEQLPNYESAKYLYIGGGIEGEYQNEAFLKPLNNMIGVRYGIIPYNNTIYVYMINQHIGGNYQTVYEQEDKDKIILTQEYQEMPIWPSESSVRMIGNDVIVVKFSE